MINKIIEFARGFYGLVIYFAVNILFSYIIVSIKNINYITYNILMISMDIVTLLLLIFIYRKRIKKDFIDFDKNYKDYLTLGFKSWFISIIVMGISNYLITTYVINEIATNQATNQLILSKMPLFSIIAMIITGPFIEEMVFRLGFKEHIKNKYLYYFLATFIFTSLHVFNGIDSPLKLLYFIPYGAMAFSFAYTLDKTDNIFTSTVIHTIHNTIAILLLIMTTILGV